MTQELLARLLEKVEGRYYGKYSAFVVDNADPENLGRLRLRIPGALNDETVSGWAMPCAPYGGASQQGFFFIPEVGAGVWAEFEEGDLRKPVWVGTFWAKPGGSSEVPSPADSQSPPTSKMIKTLKHTIELADEDGSEAIKITDDANSNQIVINADGMTFTDANQNKITLDSSGIKVEDKNGNVITMDSSSVTIKSNKIKIGEGATVEKLVMGTTLDTILTSWVTALSTHTHVGNLGAPTSPPVGLVLQSTSSALSSKHFVE